MLVTQGGRDLLSFRKVVHGELLPVVEHLITPLQQQPTPKFRCAVVRVHPARLLAENPVGHPAAAEALGGTPGLIRCALPLAKALLAPALYVAWTASGFGHVSILFSTGFATAYRSIPARIGYRI
jgi:hypothetical protein